MFRYPVDHTPIPRTFSNAANPLDIPTYEGSGQVIHPDVLDLGNSPISGYRFWMVNTPYPFNNDDYENPSVWASNNGRDWVVPDGLTNPIAPFPGGSDWQSDPCMVYNPTNGKMIIYYRKTVATDEIHYVESTNGISWTNDQTVLSYARDTHVAPQVYYDQALNQYSLWIIQHGGCSGTITSYIKYTSTNGIAWTLIGSVSLDIPQGYRPWHINFKRYQDRFVGVLAAFPTACTSGVVLFLVRSLDSAGNAFFVSQSPILSFSIESGWDSHRLYQSCLRNVDGEWYLWYSGSKNNSGNITNKMGLTTT